MSGREEEPTVPKAPTEPTGLSVPKEATERSALIWEIKALTGA